MLGLTIQEFADRLNEIIPVLMRSFARQQTNELFKGKITFPQFLILDSLHKQGEAKMSDLARFMKVSTAAMTGIADRLVRDGYAQRVYDPKDRRIIRIKATARGVELVKRIYAQRRRMIIKIFAKLPESDRREYLRILASIRDVLVKEKEA